MSRTMRWPRSLPDFPEGLTDNRRATTLNLTDTKSRPNRAAQVMSYAVSNAQVEP